MPGLCTKDVTYGVAICSTLVEQPQQAHLDLLDMPLLEPH